MSRAINRLLPGLILGITVIFGSCKQPESWYYTEAEMEAVESFVDAAFGESTEVFHELESPDIHVDILVIPPTEERNYYTLVTMGMGARPMDVPREYRSHNNQRAEILVTLPPDWNITSEAEKDYWPIRWLKNLARLPISMDTWLGWGHTVPNGEPFAENTQLSGVILMTPRLSDRPFVCGLPGGDRVEFYHMIPIYEEEMDYKVENGTDALFGHFGPEFTHVVDLKRTNYLK